MSEFNFCGQCNNATSNGQTECEGCVPEVADITKKVVVDDGFVELVDFMGSDLHVVNAARCSFGVRKGSLDEKDVKLINYLASHKHYSPFRHSQFQFLVKCSEAVCRQFFKHQVGCGLTSGEFREAATVWNEMSGRYVEYKEEFHIPTSFRKQHKTNKQASVEGESVEQESTAAWVYKDALSRSYGAYKQLLDLGVCKEQARMVMPISFMQTFVWTASLEAVVNFIKLRDHEGAQLEIRNIARVIRDLVEPICPHSVKALLGETK